MKIKLVWILIILVFLASCSKNTVSSSLNDNISTDKVIISTGSKKTDQINKLDKENKIYYNPKDTKEEKINKILKDMKTEEKLYKMQYEKVLKNSDLSYCDKYKWWFKQECQLNIIFSKYNKKWCVLAKEKWDDNLYQKCLEIENGIKEYEKIRKREYYYNTYKK